MLISKPIGGFAQTVGRAARDSCEELRGSPDRGDTSKSGVEVCNSEEGAVILERGCAKRGLLSFGKVLEGVALRSVQCVTKGGSS